MDQSAHLTSEEFNGGGGNAPEEMITGNKRHFPKKHDEEVEIMSSAEFMEPKLSDFFTLHNGAGRPKSLLERSPLIDRINLGAS